MNFYFNLPSNAYIVNAIIQIVHQYLKTELNIYFTDWSKVHKYSGTCKIRRE